MILFGEIFYNNKGHAPFNAGVITAIASSYPDEKVHFFGGREHLAEVARWLIPSEIPTVELHEVEIPDRRAGFLSRATSEYRLLTSLIEKITETGARDRLLLVLPAMTPSIVFAATRIRKRNTGPDPSIRLILHGNVADILGWRSRNPLVRAVDLKSALSYGAKKGLRFLALEEPIKEALVELMPTLEGALDVLPHPLNGQEGEDAVICELAAPIRVGMLGLATEGKGLSIFHDLARDLAAAARRDIELHVVGRLYSDVDPDYLSVFANKVTKDWLPREEYTARLQRLHFVCLPYQGRYYSLSPSGVLLDALAWSKPVIALRTSLTEHMFERFGDIGYLCESKEQMQEVLCAVAAGLDRDRYARQVKAVRRARESRLPQVLARTHRIEA
jgi:hypothetical protein